MTTTCMARCPLNWGNWPNPDLRLSENQFSGTLPESLGKLKAIEDLWLYNNQFSGPLRMMLGALPALRTLWLSRNYFRRPCPPTWANSPIWKVFGFIQIA